MGHYKQANVKGTLTSTGNNPAHVSYTIFWNTTDGVEGCLIETVRVGAIGNENWVPLCGSPWCQPSAQDKPLK